MASLDPCTSVTCAQCEPALICEENGEPVAPILVLSPKPIELHQEHILEEAEYLCNLNGLQVLPHATMSTSFLFSGLSCRCLFRAPVVNFVRIKTAENDSESLTLPYWTE